MWEQFPKSLMYFGCLLTSRWPLLWVGNGEGSAHAAHILWPNIPYLQLIGAEKEEAFSYVSSSFLPTHIF